jgi:hypothetical protein
MLAKAETKKQAKAEASRSCIQSILVQGVEEKGRENKIFFG